MGWHSIKRRDCSNQCSATCIWTWKPSTRVYKSLLKDVGEGWLLNVRDMLQRIDAGVWIEKTWRPQQQRQNDMAIMDAFASDPEITPLMMILANEYRMWLRVIYVSWKAQQSHLKNLEYKRMESGSYQWPQVAKHSTTYREAPSSISKMLADDDLSVG